MKDSHFEHGINELNNAKFYYARSLFLRTVIWQVACEGMITDLLWYALNAVTFRLHAELQLMNGTSSSKLISYINSKAVAV